MSETIKASPFDLLRTRYPANEFALIREVTNGSRQADFVAFNLWPSRGHAITGIEMKSHRSDWIKEMKTPAKQEEIFKFCDYFYLFTTNDTVARIEEIPPTWGWITVKGATIRTVKPAPKLQPQEPSKVFVAAMMRRFTSQIDKYILLSEIDDRLKSQFDLGVETGKNIAGRNSTEQQLNDLRESVRKFQQASGIEIKSGWNYDPIKTGQAVKYLVENGIDRVLNSLEFQKKQLQIQVDSIDKFIKNIKGDD